MKSVTKYIRLYVCLVAAPLRGMDIRTALTQAYPALGNLINQANINIDRLKKAYTAELDRAAQHAVGLAEKDYCPVDHSKAREQIDTGSAVLPRTVPALYSLKDNKIYVFNTDSVFGRLRYHLQHESAHRLQHVRDGEHMLAVPEALRHLEREADDMALRTFTCPECLGDMVTAYASMDGAEALDAQRIEHGNITLAEFRARLKSNERSSLCTYHQRISDMVANTMEQIKGLFRLFGLSGGVDLGRNPINDQIVQLILAAPEGKTFRLRFATV